MEEQDELDTENETNQTENDSSVTYVKNSEVSFSAAKDTSVVKISEKCQSNETAQKNGSPDINHLSHSVKLNSSSQNSLSKENDIVKNKQTKKQSKPVKVRKDEVTEGSYILELENRINRLQSTVDMYKRQETKTEKDNDCESNLNNTSCQHRGSKGQSCSHQCCNELSEKLYENRIRLLETQMMQNLYTNNAMHIQLVSQMKQYQPPIYPCNHELLNTSNQSYRGMNSHMIGQPNIHPGYPYSSQWQFPGGAGPYQLRPPPPPYIHPQFHIHPMFEPTAQGYNGLHQNPATMNLNPVYMNPQPMSNSVGYSQNQQMNQQLVPPLQQQTFPIQQTTQAVQPNLQDLPGRNSAEIHGTELGAEGQNLNVLKPTHFQENDKRQANQRPRDIPRKVSLDTTPTVPHRSNMNRNSFMPNRKRQFNTTQRSIPNNATHRTPNLRYEQSVTDTQSQEYIVENSFSKKSKTGQDDRTEKCSTRVSTTDLQFVEQENGNIEEVNKNTFLSTLSLKHNPPELNPNQKNIME